MKHLKFTFLLTVLMSMTTTKVLSYPDFEIDGIGYKISGEEVKVSCRFLEKYTGEVEIPKSVIYNGKEYPVTCIETRAFQFCNDLTSVSIPNGITTIEDYAFEECTGLSNIVIPKSVSVIESYPFLSCSGLANISVEDGNLNFDSRNDCNAIINSSTNELILGCKNTTIPNSVVSIGQESFYGCTELTCITIPNSVTKIGRAAFYGCI